jgi:hypothetical protein
MCAQVTLTKTGLSAVRTFSPLGVNEVWIEKSTCIVEVTCNQGFFVP